MKRIYITDEAYQALVGYTLLVNRTTKGMSFVASSLILSAIAQKTNIPVDQWTNRPIDQKTSGPMVQESSGPKSHQPSGPIDQKTSGPMDQKTSRPEVQRDKSGKSVYNRWLVRYAGVIRGIKDMKALEKQAREAKFLFYPVNSDTAVVVDRYWIDRAIELGNSSKLKIGLGQAEEIARSVIEGNKKDEELSLAERVGLALYMLNKDGYVIYSSSGWTLAIPDIALDTSRKEKPAPQAPKPEAKETEEKEPEAKPEPKKEEPKPENICSEKKIPEPADLDFMRVGGAVEQITIRECAEKKGYHFYMAMPELGVVVNPKFEADLLEKIRNGQVKYARADIDNAVEEYAKNRAKSLGTEEKEKILLKVLLQEAKVTYVNGEWKVVEKPKANKAGAKTGSMIDSIQGQGV